MIEFFLTPFLAFDFMRHALVTALAISISAAPLGLILVVRRMSLMGDAIAHALLPGVALGYLVSGLSIGAMSLGGLFAGVLVIILANGITRLTPRREDASLGVFYLLSLALGVILMSVHGTNFDLMHVLFGNILMINKDTLIFIALVTGFSLLTFAVIYRPLLVESFDPTFMASVRGHGSFYYFVFLILVVINLIVGFQALGTLLAVGIMIIPSMAARFWTRAIFPMMLLAILLAILGSYCGLILSFRCNWPSGPSIILVLCGIDVISVLFGRYDSLRARFFPFRHFKS